MIRMKAILVAAGLAVLAAVAPAKADVIFTFTQTGSTPPGRVSVAGTLTLTDEAYANGLNSSIMMGGGYVFTDGIDGIVGLSLSISSGAFSLNLTDADFLNASSYPRNTSGIGSVVSAPGGLPFGDLLLASPRFTFRIDLLGDSFSGAFSSRRGVCSLERRGPCGFSGETTVAAVPVPEPASLALFGAGLLGLGAVRRARRGTQRG